MKKVIYVPDNQNVILSKDIDFDKTEVIIFDELPFSESEIGTLCKTKGKWFVKNKTNGVPIKFNNSESVFFDELSNLFMIFNIEGYSAQINED